MSLCMVGSRVEYRDFLREERGVGSTHGSTQAKYGKSLSKSY